MAAVTKRPFTCAYCGALSPSAPPAHLFPKALGGRLSSRRSVCLRCNNDVNSRVENPALPFFAFYRSFWGMGGRYRRIPPVPGEARFADGRTVRLELGSDGEIRRAIVSAEALSDGK
jgi:HNH endonuclease